MSFWSIEIWVNILKPITNKRNPTSNYDSPGLKHIFPDPRNLRIESNQWAWTGEQLYYPANYFSNKFQWKRLFFYWDILLTSWLVCNMSGKRDWKLRQWKNNSKLFEFMTKFRYCVFVTIQPRLIIWISIEQTPAIF